MDHPWKNTLEWKEKRVFPFYILIVYDEYVLFQLHKDPMRKAILSHYTVKELVKEMK